jgi:hypothetical protein
MKRFLAVIAGFILWSVLWLCLNVGLHKFGLLPASLTQPMTDAAPLAALLLGSVVISIISGYIAAAIAGAPSAQAVAVLGVLLLLTGIYFQSRVWHLMPIWYHLAFLVLLIPMCFAGARLREPRAAI